MFNWNTVRSLVWFSVGAVMLVFIFYGNLSCAWHVVDSDVYEHYWRKNVAASLEGREYYSDIPLECWKKVARYQIVLGADIFLSYSLRIKCFFFFSVVILLGQKRIDPSKRSWSTSLFFLHFLIAFCVNSCFFGFSSVLQNIQFVFWWVKGRQLSVCTAEHWVCVLASQRIVTVGLLQSFGFVFCQVKG